MSAPGKGERRRRALVASAAALLAEGGPAAVSHRAVAARAALPLAATTYYFASLAELRAAATDVLAAQHLDRGRALLQGLGPSGPQAAAALVVRLVLPEDTEPLALSGFYERYLQAGREPALRPVVMRWNAELRALVASALDLLGHPADPVVVLALVDGLALSALAEGEQDVAGAAARGLAALLAAGRA